MYSPVTLGSQKMWISRTDPWWCKYSISCLGSVSCNHSFCNNHTNRDFVHTLFDHCFAKSLQYVKKKNQTNKKNAISILIRHHKDQPRPENGSGLDHTHSIKPTHSAVCDGLETVNPQVQSHTMEENSLNGPQPLIRHYPGSTENRQNLHSKSGNDKKTDAQIERFHQIHLLYNHCKRKVEDVTLEEHVKITD